MSLLLTKAQYVQFETKNAMLCMILDYASNNLKDADGNYLNNTHKGYAECSISDFMNELHCTKNEARNAKAYLCKNNYIRIENRKLSAARNAKSKIYPISPKAAIQGNIVSIYDDVDLSEIKFEEVHQQESCDDFIAFTQQKKIINREKTILKMINDINTMCNSIADMLAKDITDPDVKRIVEKDIAEQTAKKEKKEKEVAKKILEYEEITGKPYNTDYNKAKDTEKESVTEMHHNEVIDDAHGIIAEDDVVVDTDSKAMSRTFELECMLKNAKYSVNTVKLVKIAEYSDADIKYCLDMIDREVKSGKADSRNTGLLLRKLETTALTVSQQAQYQQYNNAVNSTLSISNMTDEEIISDKINNMLTPAILADLPQSIELNEFEQNAINTAPADQKETVVEFAYERALRERYLAGILMLSKEIKDIYNRYSPSLGESKMNNIIIHTIFDENYIKRDIKKAV